MPWKECHVMDERLRFVARLLEGEKMAPLCAEFGISRKTGYKIFDRYKDGGVGSFTDRSRRPHRQANRLPAPASTAPFVAVSTWHRPDAIDDEPVDTLCGCRGLKFEQEGGLDGSDESRAP